MRAAIAPTDRVTSLLNITSRLEPAKVQLVSMLKYDIRHHKLPFREICSGCQRFTNGMIDKGWINLGSVEAFPGGIYDSSLS